jgi:hypothetical protein
MIQVSGVRSTLMGLVWMGLVLGSVGMVGCATTPVLKPAPGDTLAPGKPNVAQADVAGVVVLVNGNAWNGDPSDLGQLFTPVMVTIQNNSGKSVRVSYADFSLSNSTGFTSAAIPPIQAKGQISRATPRSSKIPVQLAVYQPQLPGEGTLSGRVQLAAFEHGYDHDGFMVAPHFSAFYPGWEAWPYSYPYDPFYYNSLYAYWPEQLPTQDMLSKGLPEGVVQNNGKISGFVYFKGVGNQESSVTFAMNLVDATNGQPIGQVTIPFAVSK